MEEDNSTQLDLGEVRMPHNLDSGSSAYASIGTSPIQYSILSRLSSAWKVGLEVKVR